MGPVSFIKGPEEPKNSIFIRTFFIFRLKSSKLAHLIEFWELYKKLKITIWLFRLFIWLKSILKENGPFSFIKTIYSVDNWKFRAFGQAWSFMKLRPASKRRVCRRMIQACTTYVARLLAPFAPAPPRATHWRYLALRTRGARRIFFAPNPYKTCWILIEI